jgi:hypothetical protein
MAPSSGLSTVDVLGDLEALFNASFASLGYTATYDPATDTLSIDQPMAAANIIWMSDSDTVLDFETSLDVVPEPASAGLLALAASCFLPRRRRDGPSGRRRRAGVVQSHTLP